MARKKLDLTDESLSPIKVILWLSWPLFLEQVLSTLVSFADTAMVGSLGATATASISISNSFVFLLNGAVMAAGVGFTTYVARSVGAKDYEAAKAYIRHAVMLILLVGLPIALIPLVFYRQIPIWMGAGEDFLEQAQNYLLITSVFRVFSMSMMLFSAVLRGRGDTKTPLRVHIVVNIVNVVGNYLLINQPHTIHIAIDFLQINWEISMYGAGMGVAGAALSTGTSWLLGGAALSAVLFLKKDPTRISLKESYRPDMQLVRRVMKISMPALLERVFMSSAGIILTKSVATLGTVAVASNSIYSNAEALSYMPGFAFGSAITTLVGQALGAKKPDLARRYMRISGWLGIFVMLVTGTALYVFATPIVNIMNSDPAVVELSAQCLRLAALIQPVQTLGWTLAGALRGAGDSKWTFYITAFSTWAVRVLPTVLVVYVFKLGLTEAVFFMCAEQAARCLFLFLRYRTGKWETVLENKKTEAAKA